MDYLKGRPKVFFPYTHGTPLLAEIGLQNYELEHDWFGLDDAFLLQIYTVQ